MKKNLSYFLFFISTLTTTTIACPEMHGSFEISNQSAVFLKGSEAGAAYLTISQTAETDDKLIAVKVKLLINTTANDGIEKQAARKTNDDLTQVN